MFQYYDPLLMEIANIQDKRVTFPIAVLNLEKASTCRNSGKTYKFNDEKENLQFRLWTG